MRQCSKYLPICSWSSCEIEGRGHLSSRRRWVECVSAAAPHYRLLGSKMSLSSWAEGCFQAQPEAAKLTQEAHLLSCHINTLADNLDPTMCHSIDIPGWIKTQSSCWRQAQVSRLPLFLWTRTPSLLETDQSCKNLVRQRRISKNIHKSHKNMLI